MSKEDLAKDKHTQKYVNMSKFGVPLMAIVAKMGQEGVEKERIREFGVAFGLQTSSHKAAPKPFPGRRASKAMQKIHWTTVAEERLSNSLWATPRDAEEDIKDREIEQLKSLFGASPIKKAGGVRRRKCAAKSINKGPPPSLIDPKRAVRDVDCAINDYLLF